MKILHFYKTFSPHPHGGTEMAIKQLCHASTPLGVSNIILSVSPQPVEKIETEDFTAYQTKEHLNIASNSISFSVLKKFRALAESCDLIHYYFPWPFMDVVHLLSGIQKPTLVTYESDIVRQKYWMKLYQPLMHTFLKQVNHIVATSQNYLDSSPVLQRYRDKTSIIPIGLDKKTYAIPKKNVLDKWKRAFPQPFFLFIGTLRYYKGLHILLKAAQNSHFPILIAGSGPLEHQLKDLARELNLTNVFFLGTLSEEDKTALLTLCYAFVFPSHLRSEAFGISLLEAAMYGKPMISCDINTGINYINIHQKTGLVIPPNDPKALREAMDDLYTNSDKTMVMGKNAEDRYLAVFTAKKMAEAYMAVYRKLLDS